MSPLLGQASLYSTRVWDRRPGCFTRGRTPFLTPLPSASQASPALHKTSFFSWALLLVALSTGPEHRACPQGGACGWPPAPQCSCRHEFARGVAFLKVHRFVIQGDPLGRAHIMESRQSTVPWTLPHFHLRPHGSTVPPT